eukprot:2066618-Rhodomonas_salina.2
MKSFWLGPIQRGGTFRPTAFRLLPSKRIRVLKRKFTVTRYGYRTRVPRVLGYRGYPGRRTVPGGLSLAVTVSGFCVPGYWIAGYPRNGTGSGKAEEFRPTRNPGLHVQCTPYPGPYPGRNS